MTIIDVKIDGTERLVCDDPMGAENYQNIHYELHDRSKVKLNHDHFIVEQYHYVASAKRNGAANPEDWQKL